MNIPTFTKISKVFLKAVQLNENLYIYFIIFYEKYFTYDLTHWILWGFDGRGHFRLFLFQSPKKKRTVYRYRETEKF